VASSRIAVQALKGRDINHRLRWATRPHAGETICWVRDTKVQGSELPRGTGEEFWSAHGAGQDTPAQGSTSLTALPSASLRDGEPSRTMSLSKGSGRDARATSGGFGLHFYVAHPNLLFPLSLLTYTLSSDSDLR
jgi:hypothetical protein